MLEAAPVLAFPVWLEQRSYGSHIEMTEAMDLFALFTLGCLFFVLGVIATWAWMLWRRTTHPTPHQQLLMEMHHHDHHHDDAKAAPAATNDTQPPAEPWEKPPDWWRQDP